MRSDMKLFGLLSALTIAIAGFGVCLLCEDTDAASYAGSGTQADPYTNINCTAEEFYGKYLHNSKIYLMSGCTVNILDVSRGTEYWYVENKFLGKSLGLINENYVFGGVATPGTGTWASTYVDGEQDSTSMISVEVIGTSIPYTAPSNTTPIAGINWTYVPTTESGVSISISGASWLTYASGQIYGVPPAAGDYNVTLTMTKTGYEPRTETFTLHVVSQLVPTKSPSAGTIIYVVG